MMMKSLLLATHTANETLGLVVLTIVVFSHYIEETPEPFSLVFSTADGTESMFLK
jgi:hypothetical protein